MLSLPNEKDLFPYLCVWISFLKYKYLQILVWMIDSVIAFEIMEWHQQIHVHKSTIKPVKKVYEQGTLE